MTIAVSDLEKMLAAAFPGAELRVEDTTGGSDHFAVTIVSPSFRGKMPIERHRMVYSALGKAMESAIHALTLTTRTPEENHT